MNSTLLNKTIRNENEKQTQTIIIVNATHFHWEHFLTLTFVCWIYTYSHRFSILYDMEWNIHPFPISIMKKLLKSHMTSSYSGILYVCVVCCVDGDMSQYTTHTIERKESHVVSNALNIIRWIYTVCSVWRVLKVFVLTFVYLFCFGGVFSGNSKK